MEYKVASLQSGSFLVSWLFAWRSKGFSWKECCDQAKNSYEWFSQFQAISEGVQTINSSYYVFQDGITYNLCCHCCRTPPSATGPDSGTDYEPLPDDQPPQSDSSWPTRWLLITEYSIIDIVTPSASHLLRTQFNNNFIHFYKRIESRCIDG